MEFYNEYFDFGPKVHFGIRYNAMYEGGEISPLKYLYKWKEGKSVEEDGRGLYFCAIRNFELHDFKCSYNFLLSNDPRIYTLVEYTENDEVDLHDEINKETALSLFGHTMTENAVKRLNLLLRKQNNYDEFPKVAYDYCKKKQELYLQTSFSFEPKDCSFFHPQVEQIESSVGSVYAMRHFHGMRHFRRVDAFGRILCKNSPVIDSQVVRAFAYLHDCCRKNDGVEPDHGPRAADFIENWRHTFLSYLDDTQFGKLQDAIRFHTGLKYTHDPTINACFDADRLDLDRVGIAPDPDKMASEGGWFHAKFGFTEEERKLVYIIENTEFQKVASLCEIQDWHNSIIDQHFGTKGNGGIEQTL